MKNISLILNVILFILVGVLFYLHFSSKNKTTVAPQVIKTDGKNVQVPQIAYVDIDTFQTNYEYFIKGKAKLEAKQKAMETELNKSLSSFENEYNAFMEK